MIERATCDDFEAIAKLNIAAYAEFAPQLEKKFWNAMQANLRNVEDRAKTAEFYVCRSGCEIIGSVAYCPAGKSDPAIFKSNMASLLLLAVHPQHRGKGLAKSLIAGCIERARIDGAASIGLFTSELMPGAQQLYRSCGFQPDGELPRRHGLRYFRFVLPLDCRLV